MAQFRWLAALLYMLVAAELVLGSVWGKSGDDAFAVSKAMRNSEALDLIYRTAATLSLQQVRSRNG